MNNQWKPLATQWSSWRLPFTVHLMPRPRCNRNRTFSSSWDTTSGDLTSVLTTAAWRLGRRQPRSTRFRRDDVHRLLTPRRVALRTTRTSSPELAIRAGLTTVGQAGATDGMMSPARPTNPAESFSSKKSGTTSPWLSRSIASSASTTTPGARIPVEAGRPQQHLPLRRAYRNGSPGRCTSEQRRKRLIPTPLFACQSACRWSLADPHPTSPTARSLPSSFPTANSAASRQSELHGRSTASIPTRWAERASPYSHQDAEHPDACGQWT
jgi:hypothetical protein